jgi:hypothetical protein
MFLALEIYKKIITKPEAGSGQCRFKFFKQTAGNAFFVVFNTEKFNINNAHMIKTKAGNKHNLTFQIIVT